MVQGGCLSVCVCVCVCVCVLIECMAGQWSHSSIQTLDGCIVWNAHNTVFGSKRPDICVLAVYFLHSTRLVSRDLIVDRRWLPATHCYQRYLPCCQPAFDVAIWGGFLYGVYRRGE